MADKEVKVRVTADTGDFQSKMNGVSSTMNKTASSFQSFGSKIKGMFNTFSQGISTLSNIQTAFNTSSESVKKNQLEMEKLKQKIIGLNQNHVKLGASLKKAIAELNIASSAYDKNSEEIDELKVKVDMLSTQFDDSRDEIKKYIEELKNMQNEANGIKSLTDVTNKLKGAWQDFKNGDFGSAFEKIASAGKGLFMLMPGWVKVTTGLVTALDQLYQAGKQQFFSGLERVKDMLAPIVNMVKGIGSEVKSAFEEISGVRLDLSSAITGVVEFESAIARVNAVAKGGNDTLETLENTARKWGAETRYTATEVAEAMYYMGKCTCSVMEKSIA